MKRLTIPLLIGLLASLVGLVGCGGSILRDDYMGKSLLESDNLNQTVERDERGNPILDPILD